MHGAEKKGRRRSSFLDAPEVALAVRDSCRFLFDLREALRVALAHLHENIAARAAYLLFGGLRLTQR
ncbi:hypothetical protein D3C87_2006130 [compost metagenome]